MTDDLPPHELRGPLGQVMDAGGGVTPASAPVPAPSIAASSPGLAASSVPMPPGVTVPLDPTQMALAIARLASEMFGGVAPASLVPAPAPGNAQTAMAQTAPPSPGIAPQLVAAVPTAAAPTVATPADGAGYPLAASAAPAGGTATGSGASLPGAPSGSMPAAPSTGSPSYGGGMSPSDSGSQPYWMPAGPPASTSFAASPPMPFTSMPGAPFAAVPLVSPSPRPNAAEPIPGMPAPVMTVPLAATVWSPATLPSLDLMRLPLVEDGLALDAAPAFAMPAAPLTESRVDAYELQQPGVRDLGGTAFDAHAIRRDFPILDERVHGKRLVWLDNAATTQKPKAVIDRLSYFYTHENSNIHRAAHTLAARATDAYESGRESTRRFLNAPSADEIIFVRGATEGINLVAQSWGRRFVGAGDEIVITHLEHHANIVPWQQLCAETGARLRVAPVDDRGDVILEEYERLLGNRTRLVAFPQVSNALGTVTPAQEMVEIAHRYGAVVLVDGAQAVSHMPVDVQALDCDFYVFSGHKVFAPTGIGVVHGKRAILDAMPPWQGGGNMIQDVTFERTTYQPPPGRFEAGTGSIADAVGLGAALDYIEKIGMDTIARYEHELLVYATERMATVPGLTMIGTPREKAGVLSFVLDGQRTEDVGAALDADGIAVRSGHHCAQPILRRFGLESSVRASLAFYNIYEDIDALIDALIRLQGNRR